jgi:hypothetical protein
MKTKGGLHIYIQVILTSALGQHHALTALTLGKSAWYTLDRRLGEPQTRSGRRGDKNILDLTGTRTPTPRTSGQSLD